MLYYSTNHQSPKVDFREATIRGQAPDKGLYFPERLPVVEKELIRDIENISPGEIAFRVIRPYVGDCIPEHFLREIVEETIHFPIPLVKLSESIYSLELFHGPTLAFKDIGARFMSRCLGYFMKHASGAPSTLPGRRENVTVLVATSGDTGGAVANGFYGVEGVEVIILYPSGKVSPVQEKQLTTLGENIHALEVQGTFDDCQQMVKQAFADPELQSSFFLTSANSINVARWLPQQFYYFLAYRLWQDKIVPPVISVPSGNFGNICAGMLAMHTGLPVAQFIAACNVNDVVGPYLQSQEWRPRSAVPTLSSAMDVGDPSNFVRVMEIFRHRFPDLKEKLSSYTITDAETELAIAHLFRQYGYLADPHGAVGYLGLQRYLEVHLNQKGLFLETAHPVKFPDAVERITGQPIPIPASLEPLLVKENKSVLIPAGFAPLRDWLLDSL